MISIEEEPEEETPRTPFHFGIGLYLYPHTPHFTTPFDLDYFQTPVDLFGNLFGHLTMAESASQTVPSVTAKTKSSFTTSSMFTTTLESHLYGVPSVSLGYQSLSRSHSGVASSPWSSPMSSTGILYGPSLMDIEQLDLSSQYQVGSSSYHLMYPLYIRLPPYGEQYAQSPYPPFFGGKPYGGMLSSLGQLGMTICQWKPTMPIQPRLVYPSQPM